MPIPEPRSLNPSTSPALPPGFVFVESPEQFREPGTLVVRVPCGIRSKQKLLAVLADKLHVPGYFGWNWDALEECLSDLSWLPPDRPVAIVHEDLPFGSRSNHRATYLDILRGAADERTDRQRMLLVVLPNSLRDEISSAMKLAEQPLNHTEAECQSQHVGKERCEFPSPGSSPTAYSG